jgi:hypothetical protein
MAYFILTENAVSRVGELTLRLLAGWATTVT